MTSFKNEIEQPDPSVTKNSQRSLPPGRKKKKINKKIKITAQTPVGGSRVLAE